MVELALIVPAIFWSGLPYPYESSRALMLRLVSLFSPLSGPRIRGEFLRIASLIPSIKKWDEKELLGRCSRPHGLVDEFSFLSLSRGFAAYPDRRFLVTLNSSVACASALVALQEPKTDRVFKEREQAWRDRPHRTKGPCGNSAYLESYLVPSAFLACSLGLKGQLMAVPMLLASLRTQSKAMFLGILGGLYGYALKSRMFPLIWCLGILALPFMLWKKRGYFRRMVNFKKTGDDIGGRRYLYGLAWRTFRRHWLTGIGYNRFAFASDEDDRPKESVDWHSDKVHSVWLEDLACTGILGTAGHLNLYREALKTSDPHYAAALMSFFFQNGVMFENQCSIPTEALVIGLCNSKNRPSLNPWPSLIGLNLPRIRSQAMKWVNTLHAAVSSRRGDYRALDAVLDHPIDPEVPWDVPVIKSLWLKLRKNYEREELTPIMRRTYRKLIEIFDGPEFVPDDD